jgi:hypothetical protein
MPESVSDMKFILVVTDKFSCFTWMITSSTKDAVALAKHLLSLFCTFGFSNAIKSDQAYFSKVIDTVNSSNQVAHEALLRSTIMLMV